jgi:hypothetical protein
MVLLILPAALYIGVQIFLNRHGGMSLNLRYYLPALPFLALMAAVALESAWQAAGGPAAEGSRGPPEDARVALRGRWIAVLVPTATALLLWLTLRPEGFLEPRAAAFPTLDVPLILALLTTTAAAFWVWRSSTRRSSSLVLLAAASASLMWSACLAFDYDARWSRAVRASNLARALDVAVHISPHSLLFAQLPDWQGLVPDFVDDVIVAYPAVDDYRDFRRLATHHLDAGRHVYLALDPPTLTILDERGQLTGLEFQRVGGERVAVLQVRRAPD